MRRRMGARHFSERRVMLGSERTAGAAPAPEAITESPGGY